MADLQGRTRLPGAGADGGRTVVTMTDPGGSQPPGDGNPARQHSIWPHVEERVLDLIEATVDDRLRQLPAAGRAALRPAQRPGRGAGGLQDDSTRSTGRLRRHRSDTTPGRPRSSWAQAGAGRRRTAAWSRGPTTARSPAQERSQIEEALKAGTLPAVVATSSLELGIDMGAVDLVIQVESPPSVASGLQRIGRAGHHVGDVSRGMFFPKYRGDLVQTAVVTERDAGRADRGAADAAQPARRARPADRRDDGDGRLGRRSSWRELVRRAAPFSGLTRPVLDAVLDMLAGRYPSDDFAELRPRLVWDRTDRARSPAGRAPAAGRHQRRHHPRPRPVRRLPGRRADRQLGRHSRRVGELDEEMVYESRVGDVFVLGATSWRIEDITADQVLVSPAPGQPGRLPFWKGDAPGRPAELGAAIGAFCRELGAADREGGHRQAARPRAWTSWRPRTWSPTSHEQREATGYLPDDRTLVVERFRDELGDWRLVLHSPFGAQVHAPWALAIAARLRERYGGMDVQAMHTDDGIVIRLPDADEPPPAGIAMLDPDEVEQLVRPSSAGPRCSRPGSASAPPGRCCCPGASPAGARRCGSSASAPRSCSRWPASTARSRSCWRRCASACRTSSTCPA